MLAVALQLDRPSRDHVVELLDDVQLGQPQPVAALVEAVQLVGKAVDAVVEMVVVVRQLGGDGGGALVDEALEELTILVAELGDERSDHRPAVGRVHNAVDGVVEPRPAIVEVDVEVDVQVDRCGQRGAGANTIEQREPVALQVQLDEPHRAQRVGRERVVAADRGQVVGRPAGVPPQVVDSLTVVRQPNHRILLDRPEGRQEAEREIDRAFAHVDRGYRRTIAPVDKLIARIEAVDSLDAAAEQLSQAVSRVTHRPPVSNVVGGSWLGHPVHPVLTDLPIGFWTSAFMLDLVGGRSARQAAQSLVGMGVLSAVPTALTGLADWSDTVGRTRRVGIAHALCNSAGLLSYTLSWQARRRGRHGLGVLFGLAGSAAATLAAGLGGHLVYRKGTGVDVNAFQPEPEPVPPA